MSIKDDGAQLATAVREAIAAWAARSSLDARKIAEQVADRYPELVMRHGRGLLLDALTNRARREIKHWQATGTSAREFFTLPLELGHLITDLPPAVWVPSEDGEGTYRTFNGANPMRVGELQAAVISLERQIAADTKKCAALKELLQFCKSVGANPDDRVIDAFRRQSA